MNYEERLQAVGHLIDDNQLVDVSVMEHDGTFTITGLKLHYERDGSPVYQERTLTCTPVDKQRSGAKSAPAAKKSIFGW